MPVFFFTEGIEEEGYSAPVAAHLELLSAVASAGVSAKGSAALLQHFSATSSSGRHPRVSSSLSSAGPHLLKKTGTTAAALASIHTAMKERARDVPEVGGGGHHMIEKVPQNTAAGPVASAAARWAVASM